MYRSYWYIGLGQSLFLHLAFVNLGMVPHPSHVFALSIFNAFLFLIPKKIKNKKILHFYLQRDFLWGGEALENKIHLVKWSIVCKAKSKGGLGVCSLSFLNKVLCKWCWHFSSERDSLWKKIIREKFG